MPGPLADRLIAEHFSQSSSELVVGGVPVSELAARFGTPFYVYDAGVISRTYAAVRDALGSRVTVLYALKANPVAGIAQLFRKLGAGAEVASAGEIASALHAGFSGADLQFAGPGKHGSDLTLSLQHGVTLNVESSAELAAIAGVAERMGVVARVALRVNPPESKSGSRMRMSGGSAKFGIDVADVSAVARQARELPSVELRGLHTYAGTQTFEADGWLAHAASLFDVAKDVEEATGAPIESLNFGGGFGVPVFDKDTPFDLRRAGEGLQEQIAADDRSDRRYFVELGRYLVAESGVFLTRVIYTKESRGQRHAIVDGGMNQHATAAGVGSVIQRSFPVVKANQLNAAPGEGCRLGGPLCTPADAFPSGDGLPAFEEGDLVAFLASGAYGLTFSNVLFLSHPLPAEILVREGQAWVLRARGTPDDLLRGQHLPDEAGDAR